MVLKKVLLAGLISIIFQDYLNKSLLNKIFLIIEKLNQNQNGKMANLDLNINVHHVIVIYDFQFNLKIVDIMFVQVVYRIYCGMKKKKFF
jgi:hypothetical protein